jgi:hypothetical protein
VPDLFVRGLPPLLTVALALTLLVWVERSRALTAITVAFLVIALTANLYDPENLFARVGGDVPAPRSARRARRALIRTLRAHACLPPAQPAGSSLAGASRQT